MELEPVTCSSRDWHYAKTNYNQRVMLLVQMYVKAKH